MTALLFVLLFGTSVNTLNDHPQNFADVQASVLKQLQHPVVSPADPSKYNK